MLGHLLGGKYRVTRLLGEGGMGAVYEAQNVAIQRRVAIKTIHRHKMDHPGMMERFRREAFAMAAVESEHVAGILDAGQDSEASVAFLVMEFLAGEDLGQALARVGPMPVQVALRIAHQALQGLRAAHLAGITHRDIKPSNIFLVSRPDGVRLVKLVDFGIARSLAEPGSPASQKVTKTGVVVGSPPYMSPEQLASSPALDQRTDLWSLGVVLFEMLTGENPYAGSADLPQMLARICFVPPPLVRAAAPWVPEDAAAIVGRAMRQSPAERYPSAAVMLADVAKLITGTYHLTEAMLVTAPGAGSTPGKGATIPLAQMGSVEAAPRPVIGAAPSIEPNPGGGPAAASPPPAVAVTVPFRANSSAIAHPPAPARHEPSRATGAAMVVWRLVIVGLVAGVLGGLAFYLFRASADDVASETAAGTDDAGAASAVNMMPVSPESAVSSEAPGAGGGRETPAATGSAQPSGVPPGNSSGKTSPATPVGAAPAKTPASKGKMGSAFGPSRAGD